MLKIACQEKGELDAPPSPASQLVCAPSYTVWDCMRSVCTGMIDWGRIRKTRTILLKESIIFIHSLHLPVAKLCTLVVDFIRSIEAWVSQREMSSPIDITASNSARQEKTKVKNTENINPLDSPLFLKRVSFDTFDNRDARDFSLTLRATHRAYQSNDRSRTFLCGIDQNEYSQSALDWLIEVLVDDGDEVIALRVIDPGE
ncbi:hypothetical protein PCK1_001679 [Pneumocystis canis]|nr:hypothetical protein PCK1_001679 [Pneumocystis canis]